MPVRDATPADLDGLVEIENLCFEADRLSRRSFRALIDAPTASCRVAVPAGCLAGYALLLFRSDTDLARLYSLAVRPGERGAGLAARLLEDCEAVALGRGRAALRLEVREDNTAAIRLYRRLGYQPIGRHRRYYSDRADALRFEKRLPGRQRRQPARSAPRGGPGVSSRRGDAWPTG